MGATEVSENKTCADWESVFATTEAYPSHVSQKIRPVSLRFPGGSLALSRAILHRSWLPGPPWSPRARYLSPVQARRRSTPPIPGDRGDRRVLHGFALS